MLTGPANVDRAGSEDVPARDQVEPPQRRWEPTIAHVSVSTNSRDTRAVCTVASQSATNLAGAYSCS